MVIVVLKITSTRTGGLSLVWMLWCWHLTSDRWQYIGQHFFLICNTFQYIYSAAAAITEHLLLIIHIKRLFPGPWPPFLFFLSISSIFTQKQMISNSYTFNVWNLSRPMTVPTLWRLENYHYHRKNEIRHNVNLFQLYWCVSALNYSIFSVKFISSLCSSLQSVLWGNLSAQNVIFFTRLRGEMGKLIPQFSFDYWLQKWEI